MVYGCFDPKIRRLAFVASAITATASRWSLRDAFWGAKRISAFLPLRVVGARLDRDRDGLFVFFVCIILLRVTAAVDFLTHLLVAAAPVVMLAGLVTIPHFTSNATRRVVGQWGGAGGAICEDHFWVAAWR